MFVEGIEESQLEATAEVGGGDQYTRILVIYSGT